VLISRLYCGFEDAIEVFDVARPGDEGTRLHTTPMKKSKDGLRGIVAALAFSTACGNEDTLFAAGSLSPNKDNIALFMESQGGTPVMSMAGGPRAGVVQVRITSQYDEIHSFFDSCISTHIDRTFSMLATEVLGLASFIAGTSEPMLMYLSRSTTLDRKDTTYP
jgi:hypothetical protein